MQVYFSSLLGGVELFSVVLVRKHVPPLFEGGCADLCSDLCPELVNTVMCRA